MKKILVYGVGKTTKLYLQNHDFSFEGEELVGFVVSKKETDIYEGKPVVGVESINEIVYDEIHMVNAWAQTVYNVLQQGVNKEKIVIYNEILATEYAKRNNGVLDIKYNAIEAQMYEKIKPAPMEFTHLLTTAISTIPLDLINSKVMEMWGTKFLFHDDYIRCATLQLIAMEIKENNIEGDCAELGVYKGGFAKYINELFPEKKLHLFDTFEGFNERDIIKEYESDYTSESFFDSVGYFKETSVKEVLDYMISSENCVVHKGYFPDTIPNEEHEYAFVSIDCDLYLPILNGLKYFYPRLKKGGYIMIHEYNSTSEMRGVKEAVRDFEKQYGNIAKCPIPDRGGSLVITKN